MQSQIIEKVMAVCVEMVSVVMLMKMEREDVVERGRKKCWRKRRS